MTFNDRIFGILMLLLAVAYGWQAQQFPEPFGGAEAIGPETFPTVLAIVLGLTSLYLIVRPDPDNGWPWGKTMIEIVVAIVALIIYTLMLEPVGFIIATTLMVGVLCWRMGAKLLPAFLTGLISAIVTFVLFNYGLELTLPLGVLEF
ncbi:tripartite tricarboxylate transporter TctB family protein [Phytohalomonas tamaricis]|uniref:tripartite tricarboxylate transporter TctB family protein n=1 Tax=Phytohalomonas tamaricis TaxID=2081032 RepID=UPI000D0AE3EB|nr:tripartite tricarboxylate transporter TctB family protein [Phytohalomonas tamaricis]